MWVVSVCVCVCVRVCTCVCVCVCVYAYMDTNFLQYQFFTGFEGVVARGAVGGALFLPFWGAGVGGAFLGTSGGLGGAATSSGEGCMTKKIDI